MLECCRGRGKTKGNKGRPIPSLLLVPQVAFFFWVFSFHDIAAGIFASIGTKTLDNGLPYRPRAISPFSHALHFQKKKLPCSILQHRHYRLPVVFVVHECYFYAVEKKIIRSSLTALEE